MAKPNLLFYSNLVEPIKDNLEEIRQIAIEIDAVNSPHLLKGAFAYVFSLFESSLTECLKRFYEAFPEQVPTESFEIKMYKETILNEALSFTLIEAVAEKYIRNSSYGKFEEFLNKLSRALQVKNRSTFYKEHLAESKERRNLLLHNNLVVNRTYAHNVAGNRDAIGGKLTISKEYLCKTIASMELILSDTLADLELNYSHHTHLSVVKSIWNYLFNSPLLVFEKHWIIEEGNIRGYRVDEVAKYVGGLSTGEKTFLAYLLQNFSRSICDRLFKFSDLGMQASIDDTKRAFLIEVFNKYPLLLQENAGRRRYY